MVETRLLILLAHEYAPSNICHLRKTIYGVPMSTQFIAQKRRERRGSCGVVRLRNCLECSLVQ
jgi:hypothetical protein